MRIRALKLNTEAARPVEDDVLLDPLAQTDVQQSPIGLRSVLRFALAIIFVLVVSLPLHAQGCAQCLDSTRATPPQVQAAYRHAIYLMGGAGLALFTTGILLLRRKG